MKNARFETDFRQAQAALLSEEKRGRWFRIFTLGFFKNETRIVRARCRLKICRADLVKYESLLMRAEALDDLLWATIVLEGVRVSKHTFADLPVSSIANYGVDWDHVRTCVLERDGYECQEDDGYCKGPLQVHHIRPLSQGGSNDTKNLITLCFYHHSMKHDHMRNKYNGNLWC